MMKVSTEVLTNGKILIEDKKMRIKLLTYSRKVSTIYVQFSVSSFEHSHFRHKGNRTLG